MATTRQKVVLLGPQAVLDSDARFWTLPHPRSRGAAYYLPTPAGDALYELQTVRNDRAPQSIFLGPPVADHLAARPAPAGGKGRDSASNSVLKDGALHFLSPLDPLFLVLGLISPVYTEERLFLTLEDLFERVGAHFAPFVWDDLAPLAESRLVQESMERCCETQDIGGLKVYQLSRDKVLAILSDKVDRLATEAQFARAPDTLGRAFYRLSEGDGKGPQQEQKARRSVVVATLATWLSDEWLESLKDHLGLSS